MALSRRRITNNLKLLRASIPANIEIRTAVDDGDAAVMGNPTHIHQVVLNLATNAWHAMIEKGGRLNFKEI